MLRTFSLNVSRSLGRSVRLSQESSALMTIYNRNSSSYQSQPKLPVPDATKTIEHFKEFARALESKNEFAETEKYVNKFLKEEVHNLQQALVERSQKLSNWLTPWWLNIAYLAARTPLPVVTSPGVLFPKWEFEGIDGQVEYAARITQSALHFYNLVMSDQLPQDKAGTAPLDMSQYKFLFGTTRVPRQNVDEIRYGIAQENRARHIVVIRNGHIFSVPVLDKSDRPLPLSTLKNNIQKVVSESGTRNPHQIGIVSSGERNRWAKAYEELEKHPQNGSNIQVIENALFVVCLDNPSLPPKGYTEKDEQARLALHGSGSDRNSGNRWFDKTIQFIVGSDGYCGMTYEHTPAEGPPVAALMDFICDEINAKKDGDSGASSTGTVKRLDFDLSDTLINTIQKSSKSIDKVVDDLDVLAYSFKQFGKNFPKQAKVSPDSFIQMAFQLAFYRIHHSVPPTYETATHRKFSEGRTENIRSPNTQARDFCKMMTEGRLPITELYDALKTAANAHKKYTLECMNGAGMDRHILAWKLLAQEKGLPTPSICEAPVYKRLTHFQVSTSQVPTRNFIQMCFGPSESDCYGICYNPQEKELHFTITTFKHFGSTSSKRFAKELEKALCDMRSICSKAIKEQSKL